MNSKKKPIYVLYSSLSGRESIANYNETVILGGWYFNLVDRNENKLSEIKILDSPFNSSENLRSHYEKLKIYFEEIIINLTQKMNEIHRVNYPQEYWRLVLGAWLLFFLHLIYSRYVCVKLLFTQYGEDFSYDKFIPYKEMLFKESLVEFEDSSLDENYNSYLISEIFSFYNKEINIVFNLKKEEKINETSKSLVFIKIARFIKRNLFVKLLGYYDLIIGRYFARYAFVSSYILGHSVLSFKLKSAPFFGCIIPKKMPNINNISHENREILSRVSSIDDFTNIFYALLKDNIPKSYIENFNFYKKKSHKMFPLFPKVIITGVSHRTCDYFKIWAAENKLKGVKLVVNQHGGYYGIGELKTFEDFETSICDYFITYGWKQKEYKNLIQAPTSKLLEFSKSLKPNPNGKILLIHLTFPRFPYYIYSVPFGELYFNYIDNLSVFYLNLNSNVSKNLVVRLSMSDYGVDLKEYYNKYHNNLELYKGDISLAKQLSKCKIAVATYNATTYLETLAANFPTIIFWNSEESSIREEARDIFKILEDVGIFHSSALSAALFLNKHSENVSSWWESEPVQRARSNFCHQYARTDNNWVSKWVTLLTHEVK